MRATYRKEIGVTIEFNANELRFALYVLKAIYKVVELGFVLDVIKDIENDMKPKLTFVNHFHLCENCFCEIDDRKDSYVHYTKGDVDKWVHQNCPQLKPRSE